MIFLRGVCDEKVGHINRSFVFIGKQFSVGMRA